MLDQATLGAFVVSILSLAAETTGKTLMGEAVKDAYKALKAYLGGEVEPRALEAEAASIDLAQAIDAQPEATQRQIKVLAEQLLQALRDARPVGVTIGQLDASSVSLANISVIEGTGVVIDTVNTNGAFHLSGLTVGDAQKKT